MANKYDCITIMFSALDEFVNYVIVFDMVVTTDNTYDVECRTMITVMHETFSERCTDIML